MSTFGRVLRATFIKEMLVWRRNSGKLMLVVLLPLLFWSGFTFLMGGVYIGGIDVALVVEEENPGFYTNGLIEVLGERDEIPPSMRLIEMDASRADTLFENGEIMLIITIPTGFEEAIANNQSTSIEIRVNNAHEDMTKNLRMPVIRKLDIFYQTYLSEAATVDFEFELLRPYTYPRLAYMGWTISIYAVMFAGVFLAGSAMTQEFENETLDELTLSNQSPYAIYLGKTLSGVVLSHIGVPLIFLGTWLAYGVWPMGNIIPYLFLSIPLATFSAGLGLALGALFRNSVYLVPLAALTSIFYWITGGGIAPLTLVGAQFQVIDTYLPVSNVYRSLIEMFVNGTYTHLLVDLSVIWSLALVLLLVSPGIAVKASQIDYGARLRIIRDRHRSARAQ